MNSKNQHAPVALFVYQRLENVKKIVHSLKKNYFAKQSELYIFSDGAESFREEEKVLRVRNFIRKIKGFKKIYLYEHSENLGLANSIISGINKVLNKRKNVIVLEEDLFLTSNFLNYMNKALKYYKFRTKVMSISGSAFPFNKKGIKDYYFLRHISSHGWATWRNRWKYFNNNADYFINKFSQKDIENFDYGQSGYFWPQILANKKKKFIRGQFSGMQQFSLKKACVYILKKVLLRILEMINMQLTHLMTKFISIF